MPIVNGKEYPYTEAGMAAAEEARQRQSREKGREGNINLRPNVYPSDFPSRRKEIEAEGLERAKARAQLEKEMDYGEFPSWKKSTRKKVAPANWEQMVAESKARDEAPEGLLAEIPPNHRRRVMPNLGQQQMFDELNRVPNVSSQQSSMRQGGPMVGPGAMFRGMNPQPAPPPAVPPPQAGGAGGWRNPMEQGMQQSFPQMPVIDQRTGAVARQPDPRQEMMMQKAAQELVLRKQFVADRMRGMLADRGSVVGGDPRSVVRPQEMGGSDPRSVMRPQEYSDPRAAWDNMMGGSDPRSVVRPQEYFDPRAMY